MRVQFSWAQRPTVYGRQSRATCVGIHTSPQRECCSQRPYGPRAVRNSADAETCAWADGSVPVTVGTNASVASPSDMATAARLRKRQPVPGSSLTLFMTFPLLRAVRSLLPKATNNALLMFHARRREIRNGTMELCADADPISPINKGGTPYKASFSVA